MPELLQAGTWTHFKVVEVQKWLPSLGSRIAFCLLGMRRHWFPRGWTRPIRYKIPSHSFLELPHVDLFENKVSNLKCIYSIGNQFQRTITIFLWSCLSLLLVVGCHYYCCILNQQEDENLTTIFCRYMRRVRFRANYSSNNWKDKSHNL